MYLVKFEIYIYKMQKTNIQYLIKTLFFVFLWQTLFITIIGQPQPKNNFAGSPLTKCWELKNKEIESFASDNKMIFLSTSDGNVSQVDTQNNSQIWISSIGKTLISNPYALPDRYFVVSRNTVVSETPQIVFIRKINQITGITEWITELSLENNYQTLINKKLNKLIITSKDLNVFSIDLETGKIIWKKQLIGNLLQISEKNDNSFLLFTTNNNFIEVNYLDGSTIDKKIITKKQLTTFTALKDSIIAGDKLGNVFHFQNNQPTPKKLFRTGGEITYIGRVNKKFYVVSNDNFLYL